MRHYAAQELVFIGIGTRMRQVATPTLTLPLTLTLNLTLLPLPLAPTLTRRGAAARGLRVPRRTLLRLLRVSKTVSSEEQVVSGK